MILETYENYGHLEWCIARPISIHKDVFQIQ
jgi:hypothetical protein